MSPLSLSSLSTEQTFVPEIKLLEHNTHTHTNTPYTENFLESKNGPQCAWLSPFSLSVTRSELWTLYNVVFIGEPAVIRVQ